jgi:hypothetical protein
VLDFRSTKLKRNELSLNRDFVLAFRKDNGDKHANGSEFETTTVTFQKGACIAPTRENSKTSQDVELMFNSHVWELAKSEPQYSNKGVLIRMNCSKCGARKVAILESDR